MPSWLPKAIGYGAVAVVVALIPQFVHGFRIVEFTYVGVYTAALVGALAGLLVIPTELGLHPNAMDLVFVSAFTAAVVGGLESPVGAVVGGFLIGVGTTLLGAYGDSIPFVSTFPADLLLPSAFVVLILVLLFRPAGLFGKAAVRRV